ncbi:MAG: hypothetical protein QM784_28050 [Polyangiaceae bacterium]
MVTLKLEVRLSLGRAVGEAEWAEEVQTLTDRGLLAEGTHPVTDDPTLALTADGRAAAKAL